MPLKVDAGSETIGSTQSQLLQAIRFRVDSSASEDADFYDQFTRSSPNEIPEQERIELDSNIASKPDSEDESESESKERVEIELEVLRGPDATSLPPDQAREVVISQPQPQAIDRSEREPRIESDSATKTGEHVATDRESPSPVIVQPARILDSTNRAALTSIHSAMPTRENRSAQSHTGSGLPSEAQARTRQNTIDMQRPAGDSARNASIHQPPTQAASDVGDSRGTEGTRSRRKTDRPRGRLGLETPREPSERLRDADSASNPRLLAATASREEIGAKTAASTGGWLNPAMVAPPPAAIGASTAMPVAPNSPTRVTASSTESQPIAASSATANRFGWSSSPAESGSQANTASVSSPNAPQPNNARVSGESRGATGSRLTQYQETKILQRVLRGMEQLANGGGQVRMRLHPPELGSLQMTLRIEGTAVFAEMQVETTSARDTLMKNLPLLKERLSEQGMQIQQFDIQSDASMNSGSFGTSTQSGHGGGDSERQSSRYVSELQNRLPSADGSTGSDLNRRWTRTNGQLDFEA